MRRKHPDKLLSTTDFVLWVNENKQNMILYKSLYDYILRYAEALSLPLTIGMFRGEGKWFVSDLDRIHERSRLTVEVMVGEDATEAFWKGIFR